MNKRCSAFFSEFQHEYVSKRFSKVNPIYPVLNWETERQSKHTEQPKPVDKDSEEILARFKTDRLRTSNQIFFDNINSRDKKGNDFNETKNELITYTKKLYMSDYTGTIPRLMYSASRIVGYASSKSLLLPLSFYQDTYGRTGGKIMMQNDRKMTAQKHKQLIKIMLRANLENEDSD